jgi:hypothetical protein
MTGALLSESPRYCDICTPQPGCATTGAPCLHFRGYRDRLKCEQPLAGFIMNDKGLVVAADKACSSDADCDDYGRVGPQVCDDFNVCVPAAPGLLSVQGDLSGSEEEAQQGGNLQSLFNLRLSLDSIFINRDIFKDYLYQPRHLYQPRLDITEP